MVEELKITQKEILKIEFFNIQYPEEEVKRRQEEIWRKLKVKIHLDQFKRRNQPKGNAIHRMKQRRELWNRLR